MPTSFDLQRIAELVKLAAETAAACSSIQADGEMAHIADVVFRIKSAAEELAEIGRQMEGDASRRDG